MNFSNKDFVHLHSHSAYSRFDGLVTVEDLFMQARKMGFSSIAITDHGNLMGWIKALQISRATHDKKGNEIPYASIKPILGIEAYIARKMDIGQYSGKRSSRPKEFQPDGRKGNKHITLYAMNFEGYQNLCTLSQKSWTEGFYHDPRIDIELLSKYSKGLMCGSACLNSLININLYNNQYEKAKKICSLFKDIFGENFFLEVMYHGIDKEKYIIPLIFKLSSELDIPVVATNDCHYIKKEDATSQEVLLAMSMSSCIKDTERMYRSYDEFYLKSAAEMGKIFGNKPECLTNSVKMAERIDTEDIEKNLFGGMRLPHFDLPDGYKDSYEYLEKIAWEGLKKLGWDRSPRYLEAFKKELTDVKVAKDSNNYDFAKYFLIVQDYVQEARKRGVLVGPGRGSGYASILLRCLGITYGKVDPINSGLLWERFLGFSSKRFIKEDDFGLEK